jgi:hypothetical protein
MSTPKDDGGVGALSWILKEPGKPTAGPFGCFRLGFGEKPVEEGEDAFTTCPPAWSQRKSSVEVQLAGILVTEGFFSLELAWVEDDVSDVQAPTILVLSPDGSSVRIHVAEEIPLELREFGVLEIHDLSGVEAVCEALEISL